ncbi:MAG: glycosyltransferase family 39 protein, partial [Deltaproteobacteria bacterium]|nr:glycosyltransferase family 39 protein [Deltaproteobacteria bacterium]
MLRFLNKHRLALIFFISIHFFLSLYSNQWGLPSRWHADEKVANVLHMASQKVLYDPHGAFFHPTGYHIVLLLLLIPYYLYLTVTNYPLAAVKQAASVSWINMAHQFPEFATDIYVYARSCSALLSIFTMYFIYAIGKKIYNKTAGLVAAGSYAVCMGVVGINHFAKYISLLNLLIVLTIYFSISALQYRGGSRFNKYLLLAFLSAGFSSSIHINGPTLLLPTTLALFFWIHCHHWKGIVHHSIICLFSFITGILAGTPSLLTHFGQYFYVIMGQFHRDTTFSSQKIVVSSTSNIFGYFFEMMSIFGIPLFVFILMGLFMILINFRRISR